MIGLNTVATLADVLPHVPQPPIKAEADFTVAGLVITNSMLSGLVVAALAVALAYFGGRNLRERPGIRQTIVEYAVGFLHEFAIDSAGDTGRKLFALFGGILVWLLVGNWFALLPGVGQITVSNGHETWPLFRAVNADYNATLAMALMAFTLIHVFGARARGLSHFTTYVNIPALFTAVIKRKPMGLLDFIVGLFEAIGEFAKIISLSFRLFANVYAGEMLIAVIITLFAPVAAPFIFLEVFLVAVIQALIFGLLTIIYISLVSEAHGDGDEHADPAHAPAATSEQAA